MVHREIFIFKTGSAYPEIVGQLGDFEDWVAAPLKKAGVAARALDVAGGAPLPDPRGLGGVIVTGSHAMVTERAPWSEILAGWLRRAVPEGLPVLGVCYGHQLLADALGGQVGASPAGLEIGTVAVRLLNAAAGDPLFEGLPGRFAANASHEQSVVALPPGARLLAATAAEPCAAFAVGPRAWGVQFHPEFSREAMAVYVDADDRRGLLRPSGLDPVSLVRSVRATPAGPALLRRFARLALAPRQ